MFCEENIERIARELRAWAPGVMSRPESTEVVRRALAAGWGPIRGRDRWNQHYDPRVIRLIADAIDRARSFVDLDSPEGIDDLCNIVDLVYAMSWALRRPARNILRAVPLEYAKSPLGDFCLLFRWTARFFNQWRTDKVSFNAFECPFAGNYKTRKKWMMMPLAIATYRLDRRICALTEAEHHAAAGGDKPPGMSAQDHQDLQRQGSQKVSLWLQGLNL